MIFQGQELEYEEIIKRAVDKFLGWQLPEDFRPDGGISFEPVGNAGTTYEFTRRPVGTNLFSGEQAEAMFRACIPRGDGDTTTPDSVQHTPVTPDIGSIFRTTDREAEYRRLLIERAARLFDAETYLNDKESISHAAEIAAAAFRAADAFVTELRRRDGEGK